MRRNAWWLSAVLLGPLVHQQPELPISIPYWIMTRERDLRLKREGT